MIPMITFEKKCSGTFPAFYFDELRVELVYKQQ